jgi:hypothetical protein
MCRALKTQCFLDSSRGALFEKLCGQCSGVVPPPRYPCNDTTLTLIFGHHRTVTNAALNFVRYDSLARSTNSAVLSVVVRRTVAELHLII